MRAIVSVITMRTMNKLAGNLFKLKLFHEKIATNII